MEFTLPARPGRGGARNSASRRSFAITAEQVSNLRAAVVYAGQIGLPLNRFITIHWKSAGIALGGMVKATGHFLDLITKALARQRQPTAWIYVHENGECEGWHCHLLAHVPPNLVRAITDRQRGWLRTITGQGYRAQSMHSVPVGYKLGLELNAPDRYASHLEVVVAYMLKQAADEAALHFQHFEQTPPGLVMGKRAGTSQNIGARARRWGHAI